VKIALREALRPAKNPQGRPKTTYIKVIETQLKSKNIQTIEDGMIEARERKVERNHPGPKLQSVKVNR